MKSLKGTKTAENLLKAFAENPKHAIVIHFMLLLTRKDISKIKNIFLETADNEKEHAKRFFKFLVAGLYERFQQQ